MLFSFLLYLDSMDSPDDIVRIEVIRRAASLNCKSIVLPLSQAEITAKKRKHLILKIFNAITNDIQRIISAICKQSESLPIQKF